MLVNTNSMPYVKKKEQLFVKKTPVFALTGDTLIKNITTGCKGFFSKQSFIKFLKHTHN